MATKNTKTRKNRSVEKQGREYRGEWISGTFPFFPIFLFKRFGYLTRLWTARPTGNTGGLKPTLLSRHPSRIACPAVFLFLVRLATPACASDVASRTLLLDAALAGGNVVAVGERGTILRSTDNGRTWNASSSHTSATLTAISFADAQNGWAVGHDATILVTHDGGVTWAKQWQGENLQDSFLDVLALDTRRAIAVGAYGLYVVTTDGGATWNRRKLLEDDYHFNRISRGPTGTLYIAGEHGTLLRSTDAGTKWAAIPTSYDGSFYGVLALGRDELLAYGLRGRVYHSDDDGGHWVQLTTNESSLVATAVRLRNSWIVLGGQMRVLLASKDLAAGFGPRTIAAVRAATGIAELLELPNGNLLTVGEAGAVVVPVEQLTAAADTNGSP